MPSLFKRDLKTAVTTLLPYEAASSKKLTVQFGVRLALFGLTGVSLDGASTPLPLWTAMPVSTRCAACMRTLIARPARFREFYTREKGKKRNATARGRGRSRRRKDTAYSSWLVSPPSPPPPPRDCSFRHLFLFSSFFNKPCSPVPLRARISLSSCHNLISLGTRRRKSTCRRTGEFAK